MLLLKNTIITFCETLTVIFILLLVLASILKVSPETISTTQRTANFAKIAAVGWPMIVGAIIHRTGKSVRFTGLLVMVMAILLMLLGLMFSNSYRPDGINLIFIGLAFVSGVVGAEIRVALINVYKKASAFFTNWLTK